jgi:hypothetical protein
MQSADIPENLKEYVAPKCMQIGCYQFGESYQVCKMCNS